MASPSRIVAEHSGRNQADGGLRESPERLPYEIVCTYDARKRAAERQVLCNWTGDRIEHHEISVLARRFDESTAEARVSQEFFQVLRRQVARQIDLTRAHPGGNCCGAQSVPKFDRVERGWGALPILLIAFKGDAATLVRCKTEGACACGKPAGFVVFGTCAGYAGLVIGEQRRVDRKRLVKVDLKLILRMNHHSRQITCLLPGVFSNAVDGRHRSRQFLRGVSNRLLE